MSAIHIVAAMAAAQAISKNAPRAERRQAHLPTCGWAGTGRVSKK